jgi:hypothetical protein
MSMTNMTSMTNTRWVALMTALAVAILGSMAAAGWPFAPLAEDCRSLTTTTIDVSTASSGQAAILQQEQLQHDCFCEQPRGGAWMAQPSNSASNLAFVGVAFFAAARSDAAASRSPAVHRNRHHNNPMLYDTAYTRLFCGIMVALFLGSTALHASLTRPGRLLDQYSMYLVALYHLLYVVRWKRRVLFFTVFWTTAALLAVYTASPGRTPQKRQVFTLLMLLALGGEGVRAACGTMPWYQTRFLAMEVGCLLLGWACWQYGDALGLCRPTSLWQTHAVWHVACAGAAAFFFMYTTTNTTTATGQDMANDECEKQEKGHQLRLVASEAELTERTKSSSSSSDDDDEEEPTNDDIEEQSLLRTGQMM